MTPTNFDPKSHTITISRKNKKTGQMTATEYLPVQYRLLWFRLEHPAGKIDSKMVHFDSERGIAIFETYVERQDGGSARMHGSETVNDWTDFIEKAQTKSLGRALAAVGYGSQFTDAEFDEGERIVDAPVPMRQQSPSAQAPTTQEPVATTDQAESDRAIVDDLAAIKSDVKALGLVRNPDQWTAWKKQVTKRNLADVDLTPVHIRMMRITVEQERGRRVETAA